MILPFFMGIKKNLYSDPHQNYYLIKDFKKIDFSFYGELLL